MYIVVVVATAAATAIEQLVQASLPNTSSSSIYSSRADIAVLLYLRFRNQWSEK